MINYGVVGVARTFGVIRRGGCSIPRRWADFGVVQYRAVGLDLQS